MERFCRLTFVFLVFCAGICLNSGIFLTAQERIGGVMELDKTIHDFGDVLESDGTLSCEFNLKNIGQKPLVVYNVTTSCGCTDVRWSREPLMPGRSMKLSASYTNNEGAYPFDKTLTMYVSGVSKPVILRMRGVTHKKMEPLEKMYPVHLGVLGLRDTELKCGNLERGGARSEEAQIANLSAAPLKVEFVDVTEGLTLSVSPNPIPPKGTAHLHFTVRSVDGVWGKNYYYATPVLAGGKADKPLKIFAFTKESFENMSREEREKAPGLTVRENTFSFGRIRRGTPVNAEWTFTNTGKMPFKAYKVDVDAAKASHTPVPVLKPGESGRLSVSLDTAGLPAGETAVIVTLTTNSPLRPIVNLFITGWLD